MASKQNSYSDEHDAIARASALFATSELPSISSLKELVAKVSEIHGKPIQIEAVGNAEWETLTALWVDHPGFSRILVRSNDSQLYQTHCVLHELAHIIFKHPGCDTLKALLPSSVEEAERARIVGASIESTNTDEEIELEAEALAHVLAQSLLRPRTFSDEKVFG